MTTTPVAQVSPKELWEQQKRNLKIRFPNLTDADLQFEEGKKDEMIAKLSIKFVKPKDEPAALITAK